MFILLRKRPLQRPRIAANQNRAAGTKVTLLGFKNNDQGTTSHLLTTLPNVHWNVIGWILMTDLTLVSWPTSSFFAFSLNAENWTEFYRAAQLKRYNCIHSVTDQSLNYTFYCWRGQWQSQNLLNKVYFDFTFIIQCDILFRCGLSSGRTTWLECPNLPFNIHL